MAVLYLLILLYCTCKFAMNQILYYSDIICIEIVDNTWHFNSIILISSGTDVRVLDNSGRSPLHLAGSRLRIIHDDKSYTSEQLKVEVGQVPIILCDLQTILQRVWFTILDRIGKTSWRGLLFNSAFPRTRNKWFIILRHENDLFWPWLFCVAFSNGMKWVEKGISYPFCQLWHRYLKLKYILRLHTWNGLKNQCK